jgi:hypothetical protein
MRVCDRHLFNQTTFEDTAGLHGQIMTAGQDRSESAEDLDAQDLLQGLLLQSGSV